MQDARVQNSGWEGSEFRTRMPEKEASDQRFLVGSQPKKRRRDFVPGVLQSLLRDFPQLKSEAEVHLVRSTKYWILNPEL